MYSRRKLEKRDYDKFCGGSYVAHVGAHPHWLEANISGIEFLFDNVQNELAFCREDRNTYHWGYFLEAKPRYDEGYLLWTNSIVTAQYLLGQLRQGRWSRFVVLLLDGKYSGLKAYLFFRRDGTGFFKETSSATRYPNHPDANALPFSWEPGALGLAQHKEILTLPIAGNEARWEEFCVSIVDKQIAPRLADPFHDPEYYTDVPFGYARGSEAELRSVTMWIAQSHFDQADTFVTRINTWGRQDARMHDGVHVHYAPRTHKTPGGLMDGYYAHQPMAGGGNYVNPRLLPPRLCALFDLAFEHNTLQGHKWLPIHEYNKAWFPLCRESGWRLQTNQPLDVIVYPPSAHERAESLLCLAEWLEGKVDAKQKNYLLGLEERL